MGSASRALVLAVLLAALVGSATGVAHADRIATLVATLERSGNEKARLAAAVSLGRLSDPRATDALAAALSDESRAVRAVAATVLGRLGDPSTLTALRRAARDRDPIVRRRAAEAIAEISRHTRYRQDARRLVSFLLRRTKLTSYQMGGHEPPLMVAPEPEIYLIIASSSDKSPRARKSIREFRQSALKRMFINELSSFSTVTLDPTRGQELNLEPFSLDLSIERCSRHRRGRYTEIGCTIRVAISDHNDKMLSFLSGGAKVRVPTSTFRRQYLRHQQLRAIEGAVKNVNADLVDHLAGLRRRASTR